MPAMIITSVDTETSLVKGLVLRIRRMAFMCRQCDVTRFTRRGLFSLGLAATAAADAGVRHGRMPCPEPR